MSHPIRLVLAGCLTWFGQGIAAEETSSPFVLSSPPGQYARPVGSPSADATRFESGKPTIATTYFYWYNVSTGAHIRDQDGTDALTDHPPTLTGFSFTNVAWHAQQLADMEQAGIDVLLPVYWGNPGEEKGWSNRGLPPLVAAREELVKKGQKPPAIGMFYDTSTLRHNAARQHVDLRTPEGRLWFFGTIRDFFSLIPAEHRVLIDGKPLVFLYASAFAKGVDAKLFPAVRKLFRQQFGSDLFLVKMQGWPGDADSRYMWGGAIRPQYLETAAFGPGYDHSAVPGRTPLVRDREEGQFYRRNWETFLSLPTARRAWLVHLETWNEFHEGTDICESREYGRQYIELTRHYADLFHAGRRLPSGLPDRLSVTPDQSAGITLVPQPDGDGRVRTKTVAGRTAWSTQPTERSPQNRYVYFDVDARFVLERSQRCRITVDYLDQGPEEFWFEYDSNDPDLQGLHRFFRMGHRQPMEGTGAWKHTRFTIPFAAFSGRANGADFRFGCRDADLILSRITLEIAPEP